MSGINPVGGSHAPMPFNPSDKTQAIKNLTSEVNSLKTGVQSGKIDQDELNYQLGQMGEKIAGFVNSGIINQNQTNELFQTIGQISNANSSDSQMQCFNMLEEQLQNILQ